MTQPQLARRESQRRILLRVEAAQQAQKVRECLVAWGKLTVAATGTPYAKKEGAK